ncbi:hypothetical protein LJR039_001688 [Pseudorhodoferax sp. LjRoot39]|uniref:hypothetical protein n=1 Tax=Pseudorhodoferax sp. LjRoot39 TaxID=3342328 RepID=UPI003ECEB001
MTTGRLALAGVLLLALAAAAEVGLVAPLRAEQAALAAVVPPAPRADAAQAAPAAQLAQFQAAFPPLEALAEALAALDGAAREAGVPLRAAEYRLEQRADDPRLARYRIALRTTGDYAQVRGFLGRLLERNTFVALDDVQFRRAADATLEADLRLSLYLRRP